MPAKKDPFWETALKSLVANNPTWGAGRIKQALEQMAARLGREDAPGERWVGNFLAKLKKDPVWPKEEGEYRTFHWPESMERGDLPWEASASALELLFNVHKFGIGRPTIRQAKWFWYITLSAPDASFDDRIPATLLLSTWEALGERTADQVRGIEWYLAYAPWRVNQDEPEERRSEWYEEVRDKTDKGEFDGENPIHPPVPPFPPIQFIDSKGTGIPMEQIMSLGTILTTKLAR